MKQGWEVKNLGDVCEILDKLRKPITKKNRISGDYPYYGATGILDYVHDFIFNEKLILIGEDGAKWNSGDRSSFIVLGKYWVNNHAHVVRPDREIILDNWIVYFLNFSDLSKYITGLTVPKLNQGKLRSIEIPVPPLPEQQRIVEILDKAFVAIDKAKQNVEQNLKNAKEIFENYLQGVFEDKRNGGEEKRLGEVISEMMTGPFGSMLHKSDYVKNGIPVINPQNIINSKIIPLQKTMVSEDTFKRLEKYALRKNDIIIARRGEMGRCAIVKNENIGWLCGTGSLVIRVNKKKTDESYLAFYLSSSRIKTQLESSSIGATMSNLNQKILSKLRLVLPSIQKQKTTIKNIESLSTETKKLEEIYQQKLNNLDELKKSILQKAFRGEL